MEAIKATLLALVFVVAEMPQMLGFPVTAPAFLWSPQHYRKVASKLIISEVSSLKEINVVNIRAIRSLDVDNNEFVEYRTISPEDLTRSVLSEGGWSSVVCSQETDNEKMDVAVVFIGKQLKSSDISRAKQQDSSLVDTLKRSITASNFSIAFPYVTVDEQQALERSLVEGFAENCAQGLGVNRIAYLGGCNVNGENVEQLEGLHSVHDFLDSRTSGKTDLILLCSGTPEELDNTQSEGEVLTGVVNSLKHSNVKYTVLYASRPHRAIQYPGHLALRFLAEGNNSSASANLTCDGVCQIKSSLLEGIFVAIVLLIILISGLCCMIGIDTPTRFETPQES